MQFKKIANFIKWFTILGLLILGVASKATAQTQQHVLDAEVAEKYMNTYGASNIQGLREFLADNAVFDDPSSHFEGADAIVEGLTTVFSDITRLEFDLITKYRSGNQFVYSGLIDFKMILALSAEQRQEFSFKLDFMVVLKIENGKVLHHTDYIDSEAFKQQLKAQLSVE